MGKCAPTLGTRISRHTEPKVVVLVVNSFCLFNLEVDWSVGPAVLKKCFGVTVDSEFLEQ